MSRPLTPVLERGGLLPASGKSSLAACPPSPGGERQDQCGQAQHAPSQRPGRASFTSNTELPRTSRNRAIASVKAVKKTPSDKRLRCRVIHCSNSLTGRSGLVRRIAALDRDLLADSTIKSRRSFPCKELGSP